ncbi:MAG TPA: response regulator [Clostridiales bacterium]|nr:response regulator [Clostridiales bacterium]
MLKVILVEDEKILLEDLRDNFYWASAGIEITETARNGREALEKIKANKSQVVVTDIKMPVKAGIWDMVDGKHVPKQEITDLYAKDYATSLKQAGTRKYAFIFKPD